MKIFFNATLLYFAVLHTMTCFASEEGSIKEALENFKTQNGIELSLYSDNPDTKNQGAIHWPFFNKHIAGYKELTLRKVHKFIADFNKNIDHTVIRSCSVSHKIFLRAHDEGLLSWVSSEDAYASTQWGNNIFELFTTHLKGKKSATEIMKSCSLSIEAKDAMAFFNEHNISFKIKDPLTGMGLVRISKEEFFNFIVGLYSKLSDLSVVELNPAYSKVVVYVSVENSILFDSKQTKLLSEDFHVSYLPTGGTVINVGHKSAKPLAEYLAIFNKIE